MRHKELAYGGAEDSEYEESSQYEESSRYEQGEFGNGFRDDDDVLASFSDGAGEPPATQWEAIQEAFRQLRKF